METYALALHENGRDSVRVSCASSAAHAFHREGGEARVFGHGEVSRLHHALHKAALIAALPPSAAKVKSRAGVAKPRVQATSSSGSGVGAAAELL